MDIAILIGSLPFWATFIILTILGVIVAQFGVWIGHKRDTKEEMDDKDDNDPLGTVVTALLGFLAFMLAFTFSYTESRFSDRKAIVIQQANALNTLFLRSSYLPEKQKTAVRQLFNEYLDIMLKARNSSEMEKHIARMEQIHVLIWNQAASLEKENMDSELRSLFISSVNQVIETFGQRKIVALVNHIPNIIWSCLLLLYFLSMFILGLQFSTRKKRRFYHIPLITAAFSLIVALIADMDSTTRVGNFQVNQQPLIEVQKMALENSN